MIKIKYHCPAVHNPAVPKMSQDQNFAVGQKDKNIQQAGFPDGHPL
jgi:hypothetical protein